MQAARGASLTPGGESGDHDSTPGTTTPGGPTRRARLLLAAVALVAYATDVVTKVLAVDLLDGRPDVRVVGDVLTLHLVRNPGAAFSTGTSFTIGLSVLAIIATGVVLFFARRVGSTLWAWALGLLLAGITGNLTDRLLRAPGPLEGHVIDFLRLPNWPVFNVADMCINVGAALILVQAFRGIGLDGRRDTEDDARIDAGTDTGEER